MGKKSQASSWLNKSKLKFSLHFLTFFFLLAVDKNEKDENIKEGYEPTMRRRQQEQTQLEEEREGARKRVEHELKYSMLHPPRLLADNYTSRSYKELGRSKLKASKISFPSYGEGERGEGSQACLSELENARFSPKCATVGNS